MLRGSFGVHRSREEEDKEEDTSAVFWWNQNKGSLSGEHIKSHSIHWSPTPYSHQQLPKKEEKKVALTFTITSDKRHWVQTKYTANTPYRERVDYKECDVQYQPAL